LASSILIYTTLVLFLLGWARYLRKNTDAAFDLISHWEVTKSMRNSKETGILTIIKTLLRKVVPQETSSNEASQTEAKLLCKVTSNKERLCSRVIHNDNNSFARVFALASLAILFLAVLPAAFAISENITLQGKLTNSSGQALSGDYTFLFELFDSNNGGTTLWTETHGLTVTNGVFAANLGSNNSTQYLTTSDFNAERWVQITVDGSTQVPRVKLNSQPSAFVAKKAMGIDLNAFMQFSDFNSWYASTFNPTFSGDSNFANVGVSGNTFLNALFAPTINATSVTATNLTGTLQTAAQGNVTSLGTLTNLQVDNININGFTLTTTGGIPLVLKSAVDAVSIEANGISQDITFGVLNGFGQGFEMGTTASSVFLRGLQTFSTGVNNNEEMIVYDSINGIIVNNEGLAINDFLIKGDTKNLFKTDAGDETVLISGDLNVTSDANFVNVGISGNLYGDSSTVIQADKFQSITGTASGADAVALGLTTTSNGTASTALGFLTTASNTGSLASGQSTVASGTAATAIGLSTTASGDESFVTGANTGLEITAEGISSIAFGQNNDPAGGTSVIRAGGAGSIAGGYSSSPVGKGGIVTLGFGSMAIGYVAASGGADTNMLASGNGSIAMGAVTSNSSTLFQSTGTGSVAMGYAVNGTHQATGDGSIALGYNVQSLAEASVTLGKNLTNYNANSVLVQDLNVLGDLNVANFSVSGVNFINGGINASGDSNFVNVGISGTLFGGSPLEIRSDLNIAGATKINGQPTLIPGKNAARVLDVNGGVGGPGSVHDAGTGGSVRIASGPGGTNTIGYPGEIFGGTGGSMELITGKGGEVKTAMIQYGGNGGLFSITTGKGGSTSGGLTMLGGDGGDLELTTGTGGTGTTSNGSFGNILLAKSGGFVGIGLGVSSSPTVALDINGSLQATGDSNFTNIGVSNNIYGLGTVTGAKFVSTAATSAAGTNAVALGYGTTASGTYTIAAGSETTSSGNTAVALGRATTSSGIGSLSLGNNPKVLANSSITASGDGSFASGNFNTHPGASYAVVDAVGDGSFAMGDFGSGPGEVGEITAIGDGAFAFGHVRNGKINASGTGSVAMGFSDANLTAGNSTVDYGAIALGYNVQSLAEAAVTLGKNLTNYNANSVLVQDLNVLGDISLSGSAVVLGSDSNFVNVGMTGNFYGTDTNLFDVGKIKSKDANSVYGVGSTALGSGTTAFGAQSFATGLSSTASGLYSVAMGISNASGTASVSMGVGKASGDYSQVEIILLLWDLQQPHQALKMSQRESRLLHLEAKVLQRVQQQQHQE